MLSRTPSLATAWLLPRRWPSFLRTNATRMRPAVSQLYVASCPLWTPLRLSQTRSAVVKRPSRRRYAAVNMGGRVGQAKALIQQMKEKPKEEAKAFYDALLPRDKLDVMRLLHEKRKNRRGIRAASALPKYFSVVFEKNYFFKEEDVKEESTLGRGPGGQATNRRMQTAIVRHVPTGIIVKFSRFPSLWLNRRAARELLHLRLEERLVGPASRLGRARVAREQRQIRRQRTKNYLCKKGGRLQAREVRACHWVAFQLAGESLPAPAMQQMGLAAAAAAPITLAALFGSECSSWWPKLKASVDAAVSKGAALEAGSGTFALEVPLMLRYVFPAVYANATASERAEWATCQASDDVRTNVARAFVCFCELFGLRLRQTAAASPSATEQKCVLQKDGLNWVEYRPRLYHGDHLTRVGRVCWPHVYLSLRELGLMAEARAIVIFFKKEAKVGGQTGPQLWAEEALRCLALAVRESKASPPQQRVAAAVAKEGEKRTVESETAAHTTEAPLA